MKSQKVPCDVNHLADIRGFVRGALQEYAVSDNLVSPVVLSVEELCANAIIHGNQRDSGRKLELRIFLSNGSVVVETRDEGAIFNPGGYTERTILDLINDRRRGGMGLMLVRRLMDRAEYERDGNINIWRLAKRLAASGAGGTAPRQESA